MASAPTPGRAPKPWFARWWVWVGVVVALMVIVRLGSGAPTTSSGGQAEVAVAPSTTLSTPQAAPSQPTAAATPAAEKKARLTLDDGWTIDNSDGFMTYVRGYVSNNTDKAMTTYAQITFDALDASGANIGQCFDNTNTIDAHGKWKFKAMCMDNDTPVATVRFKEITGF